MAVWVCLSEIPSSRSKIRRCARIQTLTPVPNRGELIFPLKSKNMPSLVTTRKLVNLEWVTLQTCSFLAKKEVVREVQQEFLNSETGQNIKIVSFCFNINRRFLWFPVKWPVARIVLNKSVQNITEWTWTLSQIAVNFMWLTVLHSRHCGTCLPIPADIKVFSQC